LIASAFAWESPTIARRADAGSGAASATVVALATCSPFAVGSSSTADRAATVVVAATSANVASSPPSKRSKSSTFT
jgi:hypothetical protein